MKEMKKYDSEIVWDILRESWKTANILSTLRTMSKVNVQAPVEKVNIHNTLTETIQWLDFLAQSKKLKIDIDLRNDFDLETNKNMLYLVLVNLLKNALKYNKSWWQVHVIVDEYFVEINDTGVWIPKEELSKILDRFYRVKNHRDAKWYGLGLSLVKKICDQYNWTIKIDSIENLGTKIKLEF
jgi:two-component system OmpR family sensor kinase